METLNGAGGVPAATRKAKRLYDRAFARKGFILALISGICWGMYTTFIGLAENRGAWVDWFGDNTSGLSFFVITYVLGFLAAGLNDTFSGIWSLIIALFRGKGGDVIRSLKSRGGLFVFLAALCGMVAGSTYIISYQLLGPIAVPLSTLYPAMATIFACIFLKQYPNFRMWCGVFICIFGVIFMGGSSIFGGLGEHPGIGVLFGVIAAVAWGFEGVIGGFSMTIMDYEIGVVLRQLFSGLTNLIIVLPIFCAIAGGNGLYGQLFAASMDMSSLKFFMVSGFFAIWAYSLWYKGNNMCGVALGGATNSLYSFWGPLSSAIIIGGIMGIEGYGLTAPIIIGAFIMVFGILLISMNPLDLFRQKGDEE